jgi:hypothetical protein
MFFGYNVGSTIQRSVSKNTHIALQPYNSIVDNFLTNLLDQEDIIAVMPANDNGSRPDTVMVIPEMESPPLYYDCWIGSTAIAQHLDPMHMPGIISVDNLLTMNAQILQKCRHMTFICYDAITHERLTKELGITKAYLISPALQDNFISSNISEKQKTVDIAILQNSNDISKIEQIISTIQTSLPDIVTNIIPPDANNTSIQNYLSQTKIILTTEPASIIEAKYAMCFGCLIFTSDNRTIQYPGLVYQVSNIEQIIQGVGPLLSNYQQVFSKLNMEKNKLLLDNNFTQARSQLHNIISIVTQKAIK